MRFLLPILLPGIGMCLLLFGAAFAQDSLPLGSIPSTTIIIIKNSPHAWDGSPITFQNLKIDQLRPRILGQEPAVLLSETPSITWTSDAGNGQGYTYLRLRGLDQTRINISLDGVPLNEPEDQGAYFSNYPDLMNSLGNIQIQRGVGTSKSGVADYAGSIQLSGPDLGYYQRGKKDTTQLVLGANHGSFNTGRLYASFRTRTTGKAALYARASMVHSDGYKQHAWNNSQSGLVAGRWEDGNHRFSLLSVTGHQQNQLAWIGVPDSILRVSPRANANSPQEADQFLQSLTSLRHQWVGYNALLNSGVFYTCLNGNYDFDYHNFIGLPSTQELYNYTFRSHFMGGNTRLTLLGKHWQATAGISGSAYQRQHLGSERTLGQLYQNTGFKREANAFCKGSYRWNAWELEADAQVRGVAFLYQGSVELPMQKWLFFNPKAGASYRISEQWLAYVSLGSVGREPTRNDLFGGNDDLLADSIGQPLLFITQAERVVDAETGVRRKGQRSAFSANVYFLSFRNEIVLNGQFGPNGLALSQGVDRSFRSGVEVSGNYRMSPRINLRNNSSLSFNRILAHGTVFQPVLTPALLVNQEVEYAHKGWLVGVCLRYQSEAFINLANTDRVEGALIANAWLQYRWKGFTVGAQGNNLLNARYYNSGYTDFAGINRYFIQAPIHGSLSIAFSF